MARMTTKPKERQLLTKSPGRWTIIWTAVIALIIGTISLYSLLRFQTTAQRPAPTSQKITPTIKAVGALGRLEPKGEITRLSAPISLQGTRIGRILVKQGDEVHAGQVVAILDTQPTQLAALKKAEADVEVDRSRLAQVEAGAKAGDIAAQKAAIANLKADLSGQIATQQATIARLEDELHNAETVNWRYQRLYRSGAISAYDSDNKRLSVDTAREQLNEAKATLQRTIATNQKQQNEAKAKLESIAEVRPTDVQEAKAELESVIAAAKQAQAQLDLTYIRAPISGQILKVYSRAGEVVGSDGIAEIGHTNQMYVTAEVYETDIRKVQLGQEAIITSDAFSGKLRGTVTRIGLQVSKQNIFENDPTAITDNKVVEVKIRLNSASSLQVSGLSNLQVQVIILPSFSQK
ncbi:MAG: ABC exporter membrane fusion protein [Chroococcidiopsidaceae cyanobacterium CP_BM_ER_R8_30]|nr:ABC exporter membrane fusion protein [Chroococcidiopsidaceae cyanobacterium CP_BM_ER_R8_30]